MSLDSICNTTATIERQTAAVTSNGANSPSWTTVYSDLQCTIQPAKGSIIERFARVAMLVSHTLYTPTQILLKAGDRVTDADNRKFQVQSFADQGARGKVFAAYLQELDP